MMKRNESDGSVQGRLDETTIFHQIVLCLHEGWQRYGCQTQIVISSTLVSNTEMKAAKATVPTTKGERSQKPPTRQRHTRKASGRKSRVSANHASGRKSCDPLIMRVVERAVYPLIMLWPDANCNTGGREYLNKMVSTTQHTPNKALIVSTATQRCWRTKWTSPNTQRCWRTKWASPNTQRCWRTKWASPDTQRCWRTKWASPNT